MSLCLLNFPGDFAQGFTVNLTIWPGDSPSLNMIAGADGRLPPAPDLIILYERWKDAYGKYLSSYHTYLEIVGHLSTHNGPATFALKGRAVITNPNIQEAENQKQTDYNACVSCENQLIERFNQWLKSLESKELKSPESLSIVETLRHHLGQSKDAGHRILIQSNDEYLRKMPWTKWNLLKDFLRTEIGLISPNFEKRDVKINRPINKLRILTIIGKDANIQGEIEKLATDNIEIKIVPNLVQLDERLWREYWDIIIFNGHSKTEHGRTGEFVLSDTEKLTISNLRGHFNQAIERGLKLVIFNSCDGLGLAHQLGEGEKLYLSQVIVMRELLPAPVAPIFLGYFFEEFIKGVSLYEAMRLTKDRLLPLETQYPGISALPVICQNPTANPLHWFDLVIPPNPYQGLSAFQEKDAALFFGRETFTNQLVKVVETEKLVAVIGASGSGKSSVVSAGLIPVWKAEATEILPRFVVKIRPGFPQSNPWENLAEELGKILPSLTEDRIKFLELVVNLEANEQELTKVLTQIVQTKVKKSACKVLLVIDQFEEFYTLCPSDKCLSFLSALVYAVNHEAGWTIVLTLRADFLPQALDYEALGKILNQGGKELITAMTDKELIEAITLPVQNFEVEFSEQLINKIIQDYRKNSGHLPMLQFALEELWKQQNYGFISLESYEKMGGLTKVLGNYAENIYLRLGEDEKERSRQIMTQLVQPITQQNPGEVNRIVTRKIATIKDIGKENWQLVTKFADQRLVVTDEAKGASVELIHEVLITAWERLKIWIDQDWDFRRWQERLRDDLIKWEREKKDEDLLQGGLLKEAESWLEQRGKQISEKERGYIEKSQKKRDRQRQQLISGLTAGLVTVSLLAIGAVWQWRQAEITKSDVMARSADILLSQGKELDALMETLRAGVLVQRLKAKPSMELIGALQQAVSEVRERNRLEKPSDYFVDASFSPDGKILAFGSYDKTIKLWNVTTNQEIRTLKGHSDSVLSVSFSPDGKTLASGSSDNTIKLWDVTTGKEIRTLQGHTKKGVNSVRFSPDGKILAVCGFADGVVKLGLAETAIKLWDVNSGKEIRTLKGHSASVRSVSFSPDGKTLVSGDFDNTIKLWDVTTGKEIRTPNIGEMYPRTSYGSFPLSFSDKTTDFLSNISFSPNGKTLAFAIGAKPIIWDIATGQKIKSFDWWDGFNKDGGEDKNLFSKISFSPDGKTLAVASQKTIKLWNIATGTENLTLKGHSDSVESVSFSPDGKTLASSSADKTIKLWDVVTTEREIITLYGDSEGFMSVSFSPDGKTLAFLSRDKERNGIIKLWDVNTSKEISTLTGNRISFDSVSFSPDGKTLAFDSDDRTIKLWNVTTNQVKEIRTLKGHIVSFSPDGKTLASGGSNDNTIKLWDISTGKEIRTLKGHRSSVKSVSFSPDGKTLASGSDDRMIKLWDISTGKEIHTLQGHSNAVSSVSFSPDGKTLASGSGDRMIKLWDVTTGQEIYTLKGHGYSVNSVSFSRDGKTLASGGDSKRFGNGSSDNTIKLWDVSTGKEIRTLRGHSDSVNSVSFSPDGKTLASGSDDKTVILWNLNFDDLLVRGCDKVRAYLHNPSANVSDSDRHLCDGISKD